MVDSIITLFKSTETIFATNGLGSLPDAISCLVEEEINGEYDLEMEYPVDGRRYSDLALRRIIFTKTEPDSKGQPFRIYAISKPINGVVTINAQHISYDLSGYPLKPFSATGIQKTLTGLKTNSVENHPFIFSSDKNLTSPFSLKTPASTRVALGGMEGSVLDVYRGEYEWDKFNVILHTKRGVNRGVTIRYGKNLTDIQQDENCNNVYTGVYPYWYSEDEEGNSVLVELTEKIIQTPGTFNYVKILSLDLTERFLETPTITELKSVAQSYISTHNIGVPNVSIDVAFEPLMRSPEYAEFAMLETVKLGDTVTVEFPKMDIQATSKCVKTIFNVITDKYVTITLGSTKSNLASTMAGQARAIAEKPSSYIIDVIKAAVFEKVSIDQLEASNATITNLVVETAQIADARIYNLEVDTAEITDLVAENIVSINLHSENITAMNADIQDLEVTRATIAELEATNANVTNLQSEVADIDTLVSGNLTSENIQSLNLTSKNTVIEDALIKDAMIADLGVDKLKAGDISTNKFNIVSDSGNFTIVDNTIQVTDGTKVRVQIGKDASGDYNMYVWDPTGNLMFNAAGITEDAIQSAIIRDDMVSTDANINAAKIDIGSLFKVINEDNTQTLNSSKIMFDAEGQTLDVKLSSLTTTMEESQINIDDVASNVSTLNTELNMTNGSINTIISSTELDTLSEDGTTFYQKYSQTEQELGNYKIELGELTTEFNNVTEDIDTKITDQRASLNLVADEISTKVSREEYDTKTETLDASYTELKQDYEGFKGTVQVGGGNNLIKNSVGYGGFNYWEVERVVRNLITHNPDNWENGIISTSGGLLPSTTSLRIKTYIKVLPNTTYSLTSLNNNNNTLVARDYDENHTFIPRLPCISTAGTESGRITFTTLPDTHYIKVYFNNMVYADITPQDIGDTIAGRLDDFEGVGRNLLLNSKSWQGFWLNIDSVSYDGDVAMFDSLIGYLKGIPVSVEPDGVYTVSVDVKADAPESAVTLLMDYFDENNTRITYDYYSINLTDNWTRFSQTFRVPNNSAIKSVSFCPRHNLSSGNVLYMKHPKLEKGSTATSWSPAPEDLPNNRDLTSGTSTWILEGTSKYGWIGSSGILRQEIKMLTNTEYTLSGRLSKKTKAGTVMIGLYDTETDEMTHEAIIKGEETFNGRFSHQFRTDVTSQYILKIIIANANTSSPVEISDLMISRGINYDIWSQAAGETYTLNVKVDGEGIHVNSKDGKGRTVMSPEEFAGYYNDQKIFTLNGDITEVMGLQVGGKGLFIPPVKFVQTDTSLDIVWTGR